VSPEQPRLQHVDRPDALTRNHRGHLSGSGRRGGGRGAGGRRQKAAALACALALAMDRRNIFLVMALWAVVHLGSPAHGLRALRRTSATGGRRGAAPVPAGGLTGQDANGAPLRRSKRGWMWNQFFLLEEYTGTDMQYVGKVKNESRYIYII